MQDGLGESAAALFVFFAGTAGAGVVAADAGFGAWALGGEVIGGVFLAGEDEAGAVCGGVVGAGGGRIGFAAGGWCVSTLGLVAVLGELGEEALEGGELLGTAEEVGEDFCVDVGDECGEDVEGFLFELNEGVFLAVGAEVDAFFEGVQGVEVLLPEAVDGVEEDHFFDLLEGLWVGAGGAEVVGAEDALLDEGEVAVEVPGIQFCLFRGEAEGEGVVELVEEAVVVAVMGI
jgi:hypothetical protein